ncbi:MAG: threonine synthase [Deltaproteobacteria bacterium]|nr:threonine synthase [Deltaproteobacteria bacterium]
MSFVRSLKCIDCGRQYSPGDSVSICTQCSEKGLGFGLLDPVYDYDKIGEKLNRDTLQDRKPSLWKYKEFLPISDESKIVSLQEGGTPLIKCENLSHEIGIKNLYIKNETVNPTFSFKDRAFTVIISRALEQGANIVAAVSDGNAGSSAAAYSAKAGIKCYVFTPSFAVSSKIIQMTMYGAKVFSVKGSLIDAGMLVIEACEKYGWFNITTAKVLNPYQTEGHKTLAYEICEQLGWKSPDWVISPVASGDSLGAIWKGFKEFHALGFIKGLPRIAAVQGQGAEPLVRAFKEGKQFFEVEQFEPETIADALCIGMVLGSWPLNTLKESNGNAVAVSDEEILKAQRLLATKEGIFVEPSSATTIAGLRRLINQGIIDKDETVVCVVTGSGLKVLDVAMDMCAKPVQIEPSMSELEKVL